MTREEAIKMAKADLKCMERDISGQDEMCNSHKCNECSLNYERGNMGEQKEWLRLAIKALEQEPIFSRILEKTYNDFCNCDGGEGWLKIDGKEYVTDVGYAIEGVEIFMEILKRRLAESEVKE